MPSLPSSESMQSMQDFFGEHWIVISLVSIIVILAFAILGIVIENNKKVCPECPLCPTKEMLCKYNKWPDYEKDRAFSIQLKGTKTCLQPKSSERSPANNTNLVLNDSCDEDRLRFKVKPDGQLQHYKPFNDKDKTEICLHPKAGGIDGDELIFMNTCDDNKSGQQNSLRYTFENGQIKNKLSGLCLNTDKIGGDSLIKFKNCDTASVFDLV
jgi:hypothetical protein